MAAPTTAFSSGAGTITATGEGNGLLLTVGLIQNPRVRLGFAGTFTSCVVAVRGRPTGLTNFYPLRAVNPNGATLIADSTNISLTDSTNQSVEVDASGCDQVEVWVVSGTPTTFGVEARQTASSAPLTNVLNTTVSGTQTYTGASTVSVASATAFVVGPNGTTNPTLKVVTNTASAATGLAVTSAAAAGGLAVAVLSSGTNEALTIDAKGSGTVTIGGTSTGNVNLGGGGGRVVLPGTLTAGGLLTCALQVATSGPLVYSGSGAPSISAAVKGSLYLRTDGSGTTNRAYIASDTSGTWTALTTAA